MEPTADGPRAAPPPQPVAYPGAAEDAAQQPPPEHGTAGAPRLWPLPPWLLISALIYSVVYSVLSILRHNTFHSYTFDLGILTQTIWNTAHGRLFETSIGRARNVELVGSYLGNHVRPILLLVAPLYRLWPDPRMLLVLQSVALGAAAVPLYWVARRCIDNRIAEIVLVVCYLMYPALGYANLFDFHPLVLSIPLLFLAYWAKLEGRRAVFWIAVLLALFTKEEMAVPIAAWGAVHLLLALCAKWRRRPVGPLAYRGTWTGLGLALVGGIWAVLCIGVIIPHFNDAQPYRFLLLWQQLASMWRAWPAAGATIQVTGSGQTLQAFLIHLTAPLGYSFLLGPGALCVSLPSLAYLLTGSREALHTVGYQYPAVLIPWLFLATVEGLAYLKRASSASTPRSRLRAVIYNSAIACMALGTVAILSLPRLKSPHNPISTYAIDGAFSTEYYHKQAVEALQMIPPAAGVASINRFGSHLSQRRVLLPLEYPPPLRLDHLQEADYVLLDMVDCRAVEGQDQREQYARIMAQVLGTGDFCVRYWADRLLLLERVAAPSEETRCVTLSQSGLPQCVDSPGCLGSELCQVGRYITELVEEDRPCWP